MNEFANWKTQVIAKLDERGVPVFHDSLISHWNLDHSVEFAAIAQEAEHVCNQPPERFNQAERCGCFRCARFFPPDEIVWEDGLAECPACRADAVLPESEDLPLTTEMLRELSQKQFGWNPF